MTSLLGYLELIRFREGTTEQKKKYLDCSLQKVEQIRSLSDKMFEYFLVYEKEESLELLKQPIGNWLDYICENVEFMIQDGLPIQVKLEDANDWQSAYNIELLQRAMDNLFSNIYKYADRNHSIQIQGICRNRIYHIFFQNHIREDDDKVESNQIGLKSVEKIMHMHEGNMHVQEKDNYFIIELQLPVYEKE